MRRIASISGLVLLAATALAEQPAVTRQDEPYTIEGVRIEAERLRAARRAAAASTEQIAPYYSVAGDRDAELYLLNLITDPVHVEVAVQSPTGTFLTLSTISVEPNRHRSASLRSLLDAVAGDEFSTGSLWLRYLGDPDTLQAWLVHHAGEQRFESALKAPEELAGQELVSFWSIGARGDFERPRYTLLNTGPSPVTYTLQIGNGTAVERTTTAAIEPGAQVSLRPALAQGWIRLTHDGTEGALFAMGVLESDAPFSPLPVSPPAMGADTAHHAVRLPQGEVDLTLYNSSSEAQEILADYIAQWSGEMRPAAKVRLGAGEVRQLVLKDLPRGDTRLAVRGSSPFRVSGFVRLSTGEVEDVAFFPRGSAHAGGTYPLPPLANNEVSTLIVNLGEKEEEVVGQVFWDNGSYAVGPQVIPAGGAYRFDYAAMVSAGRPDLAGRELPSSLAQGFFKWTARGLGAALIARTYVRPKTGQDSYGFNCFGCCWEMPVGIVVPQEVDFLPGQTVNFTAAINYETCSGTMGPFSTSPTSITSPWPFSWSGFSLSASAAAYEDLYFNSDEIEVRVSCDERPRRARGKGSGKTCRVFLKKSHNLASFWSAAATCASQVGDRPPDAQCASCLECCSKVKSYNECRKANQDIINSEFAVCEGHCYADGICI